MDEESTRGAWAPGAKKGCVSRSMYSSNITAAGRSWGLRTGQSNVFCN